MSERMTTTDAGHELVDWIGHQWHNEGTIPEFVALEIRAAVVAIETEARWQGRNAAGAEMQHALGSHLSALANLGRTMVNGMTDEIDFRSLGWQISAVVNGLPVLRKALDALRDKAG